MNWKQLFNTTREWISNSITDDRSDILQENVKLKEELSKLKRDSSKTVVCDIDGVLAEKSHKGQYDLAKPMPVGIEAINRIYNKGYRVVLATARGGDACPGEQYQYWYTRTYDWLIENGVKFHKLVCGKEPGILYIDDKGCRVENEKGWDAVFVLLAEQEGKDKYGNRLE